MGFFLGARLSAQSGAVGKAPCSHFGLSGESRTVREKWLNLYLCSIFAHFSWLGSTCAPSTGLCAQMPILACTQVLRCWFIYLLSHMITLRLLSVRGWTHRFICKTVFGFVCIFFRRWYALRMSGVGENSSDPARAESRKRKECSADLIGPR